jgi:hypothetical protein
LKRSGCCCLARLLLLPLVILDFLPRAALALIVDIDATANTIGNPVTVFLAAGTYSVTPIGVAGGGIYDAWDPWDDATCLTPSGCTQTYPTTDRGWKNAYDVISDAISAVSVSGSPLSPVGSEPSGDPGVQDHWIASPSETDRYHVDDGLVYPTAADAFAAAESSAFTVTTSGLVGFAIRDSETADNQGGISLEISSIPEPSTAALIALGLALLARRQSPIGGLRPSA